jgi:IS4 transposase
MGRSSIDVVQDRTSLTEEMAGGHLGDERLNARRDRLIDVLTKYPDVGFPDACASDGELEALYRFLRNPRVSLDVVIEPHLHATRARCLALGEVLVIHDTTANVFTGEQRRAGLTALGRQRQGFWVHVALAVSADGLRVPLGLLSMAPFLQTRREPGCPRPRWRERFKDPDKASRRWSDAVAGLRPHFGTAVRAIHLMDREGDSYELFAALVEHGDRFVVRLNHDRLVAPDTATTAPRTLNGVLPRTVLCERTVSLSMRRRGRRSPPSLKKHPPRDGRVATLHFAACGVVIKRPRGYGHTPPATLAVHVVSVWEVGAPPGTTPVEWRLITTEPIDTVEQVTRIVDWYRTRWLIEEFFKCLKTGCAYEKRQLESLDTLLVALALLAPIAWQLLLLRHLARELGDAPAAMAVSPRQLAVLCAATIRPALSPMPTTREVLLAVARLGGHLRQNGEPGWLVLMRGMQKLREREAGWVAAEHARRCDQS